MLRANILFAEEDRQPITIADVPPHLIDAVLAPDGAHACCVDCIRATNEFPLVDLFDVDTELPHPLVGVRNSGVHAHRPAADTAERRPAQRLHRLAGPDRGFDTGEHVGILDLTPGSLVRTPDLIERAASGEHADHARVLRIQVREEQQRPAQFACRERREVRERPDRDVDDRHCRRRSGNPSPFTDCELIRPDRLAPADERVPCAFDFRTPRASPIAAATPMAGAPYP